MRSAQHAAVHFSITAGGLLRPPPRTMGVYAQGSSHGVTRALPHRHAQHVFAGRVVIHPHLGVMR